MDGLTGVMGVGGIVTLAGAALALLGRKVDFRWLLAAIALVILNDAMLTNGYGLIPRLFPQSDWNWQGKGLALVATLLVASLPAFGWRDSRLTLHQAAESLKAAVPLALLYIGFFTLIAWMFPSGLASADAVAFQLTMPGLEEEAFYRGVLLLALDRAFPDRRRLLGVDWGWGATLSCVLFGLAHAFSFADGRFSLDPLTMALTGVPSVIGVWLALRTRSVLLPVVLHNFGNAITLLL